MPLAQVTFSKLNVFCRVVALGGVTRAAEDLGIAQPAVTAHLRDLEERLGVRLVRREGRHLVLTEAGERFHRWSDEVLTKSWEIQRELSSLSGGASGMAVVAASMTVGSYLLSDLVVAFTRIYPNTTVTTQIGNVAVATDAVRSGGCDFAVLLIDPRQDLDGLTVEPLWEDDLVLVAAPDEGRAGDAVRPAEIGALPFVASPRSIIRREMEEEMLSRNGVGRRDVVLELGHPEAIKRAVANRAGLTFIERSAVQDELARGSLRAIATPGLAMSIPISLAFRRDKRFSEMQARLIEFVRGWDAAPCRRARPDRPSAGTAADEGAVLPVDGEEPPR